MSSSSGSSSDSNRNSASMSNGACIDELWTMYFDGSKTQDVSRARCVLIDRNNKKHFILSRLEFECTNNIAKYQALLLGFQKAISFNMVMLKVVGDLEIVVR